jgi:hypothetical protein
MLLFSSTSAFLGDIGEADGGPSELDARATALQAFQILDHGCGGLQPLFRAERPSRPTLPPATYYLGGVNSGQRAVYDSHCSERYADRSPFHYSSRDEVQGRASLASDICPADRRSNPRAAPASGSAGRLTPRSPRALSGAPRAVYEVSDAFVAFDGLVIQDQPDDQVLSPSPFRAPALALALTLSLARALTLALALTLTLSSRLGSSRSSGCQASTGSAGCSSHPPQP